MNIAIIPARGGSRRIPRKNIRMFHGKPIIAYSIEAAKASLVFDEIVVSTDDRGIATIAKKYGADVMMREELGRGSDSAWLSSDACGTHELMANVVNVGWTGLDGMFCCLYPTAPMVCPNDLRHALNLSKEKEAFVLSVGAHPLRDAGQFYFGAAPLWEDGFHNPPDRQIVCSDSRMFVIPENRVCDINTERDWLRAEAMYAVLHPEVVHG